MNNDNSKVDYASISSYANELKTVSNDMQQILTETQQLMNNIGNSDTWSGTSASAMQDTFKQITDKFAGFYDSVMDAANYLDKVVSNYTETENKIAGQQ